MRHRVAVLIATAAVCLVASPANAGSKQALCEARCTHRFTVGQQPLRWTSDYKVARIDSIELRVDGRAVDGYDRVTHCVAVAYSRMVMVRVATCDKGASHVHLYAANAGKRPRTLKLILIGGFTQRAPATRAAHGG